MSLAIDLLQKELSRLESKILVQEGLIQDQKHHLEADEAAVELLKIRMEEIEDAIKTLRGENNVG